MDDESTNGYAGDAPASSVETNGAKAASEEVLLEIQEVSLSLSQRKKFSLCFTRNYLYAQAPGTTGPVPGIVYTSPGVIDVSAMKCLIIKFTNPLSTPKSLC